MHRAFDCLAGAVLSLCFAFTAMAQSEPERTDAKPATDRAAVAKKDDEAIREQTIYIPYEKLPKVFEKEGRGVFLPYEKFRELWDAARRATARSPEAKPPVGAMITSIESEAAIGKETVRVTARLKIDVLGKGWHEVPLRLADAAITSAKIGERPARVVSDGPTGYKLLVEQTDDRPGQIELTLDYAKTITREPGQNSVSVEAPQAPVNRWRVRVPEAGVKVELSPLVAATEVPLTPDPSPARGEGRKKDSPARGEGRKKDSPAREEARETAKPKEAAKPKETAKTETANAGETVVLAFLGASPSVRIAWTPKAEGAAGLEAVASVQADERVLVDEGMVRARVELTYAISRAELGQLAVEAPSDFKVVNVFDPNVRQWSVQAEKDRQRINVQLFEPAKGSQSVAIELEKFAQEDQAKGTWTVQAPVVRALSAGRQQGVVVVEVAEGLRAEVDSAAGLIQVDAADLPPSLAGRHWAFAYRYPAVPFNLQLAMEKIRPRVVADSLVKVDLEPERASVDALVTYTIERAGVFRLDLQVPPSYTVDQVQGRTADGVAAVEVDSYHLEGKDKSRLVVNLARKAMGRVGLGVALRRALDQPELVRPLGKPAEIALPIPQVVAEGVEQATGKLVLYAPDSLRINPLKTDGLRAISFQEVSPTPDAGPAASTGRPVLAFGFGREPVTFSVAAERRKPQVTIRQLLVARVEEGVVKYETSLFYDILYSGVPSIALDVPSDVAGTLRVSTPSIREKTVDPPPPDLTPGCVRWTLAGENELTGSGRIDLAWEKKIDKLDVGKSVSLDIPRLAPIGADRCWGQIVVAKAETLDLQPSGEPAGLRRIDPQHDLMSGASVPDAADAFEFHDAWKLVENITRYELEPIKHASIERALLRMVVTRAGKITTQALYRMRSAGQRLVVAMPAEAAFDIEPRINGRRVTLEVGQKGQYYIPLVDTRPDQPFLLELRYTHPGQGSRLDYPVFPLEPAVQEVFLCAYLPEEMQLVEAAGPWTKRFHWGLGTDAHFRPVNNPDDGRLLTWVSENCPSVEPFPTDGRLYVFSTLQPGPPAEAALKAVKIRAGWLRGAVLAIVVLAGVLLLPARGAYRALGLGLLAIAALVFGVFQPLLVWQIADGALLAAIAVVLIAWTVQYFAWTRPRRGQTAVATPQAAEPGPEQGGQSNG